MSKRKAEVQGSGREQAFTGDGRATAEAMDPNRRATAAQMASRKIRSIRGTRRPLPSFTSAGQQNPSNPFGNANPGFLNGQNPQSPAPQPAFVFGQNPQSDSPFGQSMQAPTTQSGSFFGQTSQGPTMQSSSLFCQNPQVPTTQPGPIFGQNSQAPTTQPGSIFGQSPQVPTTQSGTLFGQNSQVPTTQSGSLFGQSSQVPTTQTGSVFGQNPQVSTTQSGSLFGQSPQVPTTQSGSVFGQNPQAPIAQSSFIFGQNTTTQTQNSQKSGALFSSTGAQAQTPITQEQPFASARPAQSFTFSTPSTSFSFTAPTINNPFSTANGTSDSSQPTNQGFTGSIFTYTPPDPAATQPAAQPFQSSTNVFAQSSAADPQPPQTPQLSNNLFSGFATNNSPAAFPAQPSQENGNPLQSTLSNGNAEDPDITMMSASPDHSPQKKGAEPTSNGLPSFMGSKTSPQPTTPTDDATPGVATHLAANDVFRDNEPQQMPMSVPKPLSNPFSTLPSTATSAAITENASEVTESSEAAPNAPAKVDSPPRAADQENALTGPVDAINGLSPATASDVPASAPNFNEAQRQQYHALQTLLALEASFKQHLASLPPYADSSAAVTMYQNRRTALLEELKASPGKKRKQTDEPFPEESPVSPKRSRLNAPEHQAQNTLTGRLDASPPTNTSSIGQKRKAIDGISKKDVQGASTEKKTRPETPLFYPSLPGATESTGGSKTSTLFKNILQKADDDKSSGPVSNSISGTDSSASQPAKSSLFPSTISFARGVCSTTSPDSTQGSGSATPNVALEKGEVPVGSFAFQTGPTPTTGLDASKVTASSATNRFASETASQSSANSTVPAEPVLKKPQFGASSTNFLSQFGKSAEENAAKEKAKRKAEDFDSEDENEHDWERRDAEAQRAKKQKLEEQAKAASTKYIPGKGFTFAAPDKDSSVQEANGVSEELQRASEVDYPKISGATSSLFGSTSKVGEASKADPTQPSGAGSSLFGSATSFSSASKSEAPKAFTATNSSIFGATTASGGGSLFGGLSKPSGTKTSGSKPLFASESARQRMATSGLFVSANRSEVQPFDAATGKLETTSSGFTFASAAQLKPAGAPQTTSGLFTSSFGSAAASPSPPPSHGGSVFDQVPSFGQKQIQAGNIFAHLSDVESGAENSKAGDADDEDTGSGEEDDDDGDGEEPQQEGKEDVSDRALTQDDASGDGVSDHASDKKRSNSIGEENSTAEVSGDSTPKPASSALSLFDRISRAENDPRPLPTKKADDDVSPAKASEPSSSGNLFGRLSSTPTNGSGSSFDFNTSPSADHTWKPSTPIKFGVTPATPSVSVTTPSPSKLGANDGKAAPSSPFLSLFAGSQAAKPQPSETDTRNPPTKPAEVGFAFGGPPRSTAATSASSFLNPSAAASNNTSRATSPGLTSDTGVESANDSTADDGATEKHDQIDLTAPGPGEEDEDVLFQVKGRAMILEQGEADAGGEAKKEWKTRGIGPVRVLKHRDTGRVRILMKTEPRGQIVLNTFLLKGVDYKVVNSTFVMFVAPTADDDDDDDGQAKGKSKSKLSSWLVRVGKSESATKLAEVLQREKNEGGS